MNLRSVILASCLLGLLDTSAAADPSSKRSIAVLEFRSGSEALPQIATRLATRLQTLTSLSLIELNTARQRYGDGLDADVVRCAGNARCLAAIGKRIAADDVVLVGISELGDVILTLQRVRVKDAHIEARLAEALPTSSSPDEKTLDGYWDRLLPASDFIRFGSIHVVTTPAGAKVHIGGKPRGTAPVAPIRVRAPASYDIRVEHPGHVPFSAAAFVPAGGAVTVRADLGRKASRRWYQRGWVVGLIGVAVVGTAGAIVWMSRDDSVSVSGILE